MTHLNPIGRNPKSWKKPSMVIPTNSVLDDVCYPQAFTVRTPEGKCVFNWISY